MYMYMCMFAGVCVCAHGCLGFWFPIEVLHVYKVIMKVLHHVHVCVCTCACIRYIMCAFVHACAHVHVAHAYNSV